MNDRTITVHIEQLVEEEHRLWTLESQSPADPEAKRRLDAIKLDLDQCWDLLRQRRALRDAGRDPEAGSVRSVDIVEGYRQ
jgi:hypothetical protein